MDGGGHICAHRRVHRRLKIFLPENSYLSICRLRPSADELVLQIFSCSLAVKTIIFKERNKYNDSLRRCLQRNDGTYELRIYVLIPICYTTLKKTR